MKIKYFLNEEQLQDSINLANGLFYPLDGFMISSDYHNVLKNMQLNNNHIWTIPITLDVDVETYKLCFGSSRLYLYFNNECIGHIIIKEVFIVNQEKDVLKIFKTSDINHPGVKKELSKNKYRVGGKVKITKLSLLNNNLNPSKTKKFFKKKQWEKIAGFQTRNPIHRGHEYLHRIALEVCDGLFINPLIGWKKKDDFSEIAVSEGYKSMFEKYYLGLNIYFETLKTPMRYAGPREAIFHAIIRRNLGCTHFIIGRDHAGVGDYYQKYEAHHLAKEIIKNNNLGIELLLLREPFYCHKCEQIVSDKTCNHTSKFIVKISGTKIRKLLKKNQRPNEFYMRKEVADRIIKLKNNKFILND